MAIKNWSIQKSNTTGKFFLVFQSDISASDVPLADDIYSEAKRKGLDDFLIIGRDKVKSYIDKNTGTGSIPVSLQIELDSNFDARIITNSDKTEAFLYIRKGVNTENPIDKVIISKILERSNLQNLDINLIKKQISSFAISSNREINIPIAKGILPKRGEDKELIPNFEKISQEKIEKILARLNNPNPEDKELSSVSFDTDFPISEAETLTIVEKDDIIYEIKEVKRGEDGKDVYGGAIQGLPGNDPFLLDLRNIVQKQSILKAGITGLLLIANTDRGTKLRIIPYKDAKVRAVVSRDKMEASLIIQPGLGAGEKLSVDMIKDAFYEINLPNNISDEKLNEIIDKASKSADEKEFVCYTGTPPLPPDSYKFDGAIQFAEGKRTATVEKDDLIVEAEFILKGIDGEDVYGEKILSKYGEPIHLPKNDDSIITETDKKNIKFYANASGELSFYDDTLSISSLKTIKKDIDEKIGDINFPGKLIITGDIKDNIKVKAKKDLTITGTAHKSLLYSENSVLLNGGISGAGRGTVWAKNQASLQYAENARIFSGNDVKIKRHCFKCLIKTNGKVTISDSPGVLIGGVVHAAKGVEVSDLGAEKTLRTVVSFGQDYLVKDEIEVREKEFTENLEKIKKIDESLNSNKGNIDELRQQKVKFLKRNNVLNVRIFNLKENFEFHIPSKIIVRGSVYPGVVLETHGRYFEVMEKQNNVVFDFDEKTGQIFSSPIKEKTGGK